MGTAEGGDDHAGEEEDTDEEGTEEGDTDEEEDTDRAIGRKCKRTSASDSWWPF